MGPRTLGEPLLGLKGLSGHATSRYTKDSRRASAQESAKECSGTRQDPAAAYYTKRQPTRYGIIWRGRVSKQPC
eukprot:scaffold66575_cov31-Tisochrysis_lutea.AAC.12